MDSEPDDGGQAVYEIAGQPYDLTTPGFAEAIARAHAMQQRPRCICKPGGIETYVARLSGGYVVKRMPDTGDQHAPTCPHFEVAADASGLGSLLGTAIREDPVTGLTSLKLDFPLSEGPGCTSPRQVPSAAGSIAARASRLSLRGLLHYMWDQAELTHWRPSFEGKRSWATVRRHLLCAAEQKIAGGSPISTRLYVPEVFAVGAAEAINKRRRACWKEAAAQYGRPQQLMLMIAEVKSIVPAHRGYKAVIKHVPDIAFAVDAPLYRAIGRSFGQSLDLWSSSEEIRMVMAATFGLNGAGAPTIARLCLMPVTRRWLPVETRLQQELVERLAREGRAFRTLLRYDLPPSVRVASVALTDQGSPADLLFAERDLSSIGATAQ